MKTLSPKPEIRTRLSRDDGKFDVESDSVELVARTPTSATSDAPMALDARPAMLDEAEVVPASPPRSVLRRRRTWSSIGAIAVAGIVGVLAGQRLSGIASRESTTTLGARPVPTEIPNTGEFPEENDPPPTPVSPPERERPAEAVVTFDEHDEIPVLARGTRPRTLEPPASETPPIAPELPAAPAASGTHPFLTYGRSLHRR